MEILKERTEIHIKLGSVNGIGSVTFKEVTFSDLSTDRAKIRALEMGYCPAIQIELDYSIEDDGYWFWLSPTDINRPIFQWFKSDEEEFSRYFSSLDI